MDRSSGDETLEHRDGTVRVGHEMSEPRTRGSLHFSCEAGPQGMRTKRVEVRCSPTCRVKR